MADLKFGVAQVSKPTPSWMKNIFKAVLYFSGLWAVIIPIATNLPKELIANIDHYILISLAAIRFTISFFHYDFDESDN